MPPGFNLIDPVGLSAINQDVLVKTGELENPVGDGAEDGDRHVFVLAEFHDVLVNDPVDIGQHLVRRGLAEHVDCQAHGGLHHHYDQPRRDPVSGDIPDDDPVLALCLDDIVVVLTHFIRRFHMGGDLITLDSRVLGAIGPRRAGGAMTVQPSPVDTPLRKSPRPGPR